MDNLEELWALIADKSPRKATGLLNVSFNFPQDYFEESFARRVRLHGVIRSSIVTVQGALEILRGEGVSVESAYISCVSIPFMLRNGANSSISVGYFSGNDYNGLTVPGVTFNPVFIPR
jgi:hypothetical protein